MRQKKNKNENEIIEYMRNKKIYNRMYYHLIRKNKKTKNNELKENKFNIKIEEGIFEIEL
jgi:hypothetical protein